MNSSILEMLKYCQQDNLNDVIDPSKQHLGETQNNSSSFDF
jgi:hypothetical protein